jgi:3-hydroxyisobutyrate dehydrogenase
MSEQELRIAFFGIGRMGQPMAGHLAATGHDVMVWDKNPDVVAAFRSHHGGEDLLPLQIAARADVLITMLPTSAIVRELMLGRDGTPGLAGAMRPGSILVDMSTSDPLHTVSLGAELARYDIAMVDAPVAGGVVFARDATLDILVGGAPEVVERITPLLSAMGRSHVHCGRLGTAHALKALNNYVNAAVLAVNLEAMVAGRKFGLREDVLLPALVAATMGRNHPYEKKIKPHVLTRAFASGMDMGLIAKDVDIARNLVAGQGLRGPIVEAVAKLWSDATAELGFNRDQTEIALFWEEPAGLRLGEPAPDAERHES